MLLLNTTGQDPLSHTTIKRQAISFSVPLEAFIDMATPPMSALSACIISLILALLTLVDARIPGVYSGGSWQTAHATFYGGNDASGTMGTYSIFLLIVVPIHGRVYENGKSLQVSVFSYFILELCFNSSFEISSYSGFFYLYFLPSHRRVKCSPVFHWFYPTQRLSKVNMPHV